MKYFFVSFCALLFCVTAASAQSAGEVQPASASRDIQPGAAAAVPADSAGTAVQPSRNSTGTQQQAEPVIAPVQPANSATPEKKKPNSGRWLFLNP